MVVGFLLVRLRLPVEFWLEAPDRKSQSDNGIIVHPLRCAVAEVTGRQNLVLVCRKFVQEDVDPRVRDHFLLYGDGEKFYELLLG